MAHKKAAGSKARQGGNVRGKRLGLKVSSGEIVKAGEILIRQIGSRVHAGVGVKKGRDFTLFATEAGRVNFKVKEGSKYIFISSKDEKVVSPKKDSQKMNYSAAKLTEYPSESSSVNHSSSKQNVRYSGSRIKVQKTSEVKGESKENA